MFRPTARITALSAVLGALGLLLAYAPALAERPSPEEIKSSWCDDSRSRQPDDRYLACEVREIHLDARRSLAVDGGVNGGVKVYGWNGDGILVLAKVEAWSDSERDAEDALSKVEIETGQTIEATGPRRSSGWWHDGTSWAVSYRIFVPLRTDLSLRTHNGGIGVEGVTGKMDFEALNGALALSEVAGDVRGRTTNGSLAVSLDGTRWSGEGLDLKTTNGSVNLRIPDGYNANLETGTTNGRMRIDFPVTVRGDLGRRIHTSLGEGGATIRAITTNGAVRVRRIG